MVSKADTTSESEPCEVDSRTMLQPRHHCSAVGPAAPKSETLEDDPTFRVTGVLNHQESVQIVQDALKLGCMEWWRLLG